MRTPVGRKRLALAEAGCRGDFRRRHGGALLLALPGSEGVDDGQADPAHAPAPADPVRQEHDQAGRGPAALAGARAGAGWRVGEEVGRGHAPPAARKATQVSTGSSS